MAGRAKTIQRFMESEYARTRWPDVEERRNHARAFADAGVDTDSDRTGFFVDLSDYEFASKDGPTWIHACTIGQYDHPYYEPDMTNFTPEKITRFHDHIQEKVTDIDPDIDYEHKRGAKGGAAAGWVIDSRTALSDDDVKEMEKLSGLKFEDKAKGQGLWVQVRWTEPALQALKNGEYRYFSPEYSGEWTHPKKKTTYQDVFMGGGITNRPFLKDLTPLNFDEALDAWERDRELTDPEEGDGVKLEDILKFLSMTREEACTKLELKADATDDEIIDAAKSKMLGEPADPPADPPVVDPTLDEPELTAEFVEAYPAEAARLKKLEEDNAANAAALLETRTDAILLDWFEGRVKNEKGEAVKRSLPPVVRDKVREFRLSLSGDRSKTFDEIMLSIVRAGTVSLESVSPTDVPDDSGDADMRMVKAVKELQDKAKEAGKELSFQDGVRQVTAEQPELGKAWLAQHRPASGE